MKTLKDVDVEGKIVLVRVDYNCPLAQVEDGSWQVTSDFRIRASLPTLDELQTKGAKKIVLISHLGRPKGVDPALSLRPVAERLAMILAEQAEEVLPAVSFVDQIVGEEVKEAVAELPKGGILLLENLRFDPREKANDPEFARELVESTGAEVFVQDGFAALHRAHASTSAITKILPSVAGKLVEKEVATLTGVMKNPEKPLVVVIGGAKVEDKVPLVEKFLPVADKILVGGRVGVALSDESRAQGHAPGRSGQVLMSLDHGFAAQRDTQPLLTNVYIAEDFDEDGEGDKLDIGPVATGKFIEEIKQAKTVLWNGVLGKVEDAAFATGSEIVAKYIGEHPEIQSVICGGDTVGFVQGLMENDPELSYGLVSTGGGASLILLTGGEMPGLEALEV